MLSVLLAKTTLVRLIQFMNASLEIFMDVVAVPAIFFSKEIFVSDEQPLKAFLPIENTLSGILIWVRLEQPSNADSQINSILFGSVTFLIFTLSLNAS